MGERLIVLGLFVLLSFTGQVFSENTCDNDWTPYKDEKCLKIFDTELNTYEEAQSYCKQKYDADLVSIGFEEKQKFLEDFLKSEEIADYIWIGLKYDTDNKNYVWVDGENFVYSNWESDSQKNDPEYCVQMNTDDTEFGKWVEVLCTKKNLVLCEKVQPWSSSQLQNEFMNLKKNLMPVGFTYVQLPKDVPPADLWPWMTWKDVSSDYAGVFFRVEGGNAAGFGQIQEADSPRLRNVHRVETSNANYDITIEANGQRSAPIDADDSGHQDRALQFTVTSAEVRPRNMAVRIWKRIE